MHAKTFFFSKKYYIAETLVVRKKEQAKNDGEIITCAAQELMIHLVKTKLCIHKKQIRKLLKEHAHALLYKRERVFSIQTEEMVGSSFGRRGDFG